MTGITKVIEMAAPGERQLVSVTQLKVGFTSPNERTTMNFRAFAALAVAVSLLSACASGPKISELKSALPALEQGKGRVYFYRTGIIGAAYQPDVTLNDQVVGTATPRGVYFKDVPPGNYTVTTKMTSQKVSFALAAGQKQYIRLSYSFGFNIYPELIERSVGESEIQDLSYSGAR